MAKVASFPLKPPRVYTSTAWTLDEEPSGAPPQLIRPSTSPKGPRDDQDGQNSRERVRKANTLGRVFAGGYKLAPVFHDDQFEKMFHLIDQIQELALPIIAGVVSDKGSKWYLMLYFSHIYSSPFYHGTFEVVALFFKNYGTKTYNYYFTSDRCPPGYGEDDKHDQHARMLASSSNDDGENRNHGTCHLDRWQMMDCAVAGHYVTLHFFANDIIMCFHFALATKAITEALLPGGSLNPPSKAVNPIITTLGSVLVPIFVFLALLEVLIARGSFDDELDRGVTRAHLTKGWGIITATDCLFAWLVGRFVFGDGHPAIDFLLLMAVFSEFLAVVFIGLFYSDPDHPIQPIWLLLVAAAMGWCYALRKWHFRKERRTHQAWQPYILIGGSISWIGIINARLHPALALVPIVPWMPGPDKKQLESLDNEVEEALEDKATDGKAEDMIRAFRLTQEENHSLDDEEGKDADWDVNVKSRAALHRSKEEDRDKGPSVTRLRQRRNMSDEINDIIRGTNRHGTLRGRHRTLSMPTSSLIHYPANVQSKEELNLNTLLVEHKEHP